MSQEHRDKIKNSNILTRLIKCAEGEIEMNSVQAQVGLGLIKKVMPDLTAVGGDEDMPPVNVASKMEITIVDPQASSGEGIPPAPESGEV